MPPDLHSSPDDPIPQPPGPQAAPVRPALPAPLRGDRSDRNTIHHEPDAEATSPRHPKERCHGDIATAVRTASVAPELWPVGATSAAPSARWRHGRNPSRRRPSPRQGRLHPRSDERVERRRRVQLGRREVRPRIVDPLASEYGPRVVGGAGPGRPPIPASAPIGAATSGRGPTSAWTAERSAAARCVVRSAR